MTAPPTAPGLYNGFTARPVPPDESTMWPPRDRRPPETAKTEPVQAVIRDNAIKLIGMGLLSITTWAVVYIAQVVPLTLQRHELKLQGQDQFNTRVVGILEQHKERDDQLDVRVRDLEKAK